MNINIHYQQVAGPWEQLVHLEPLALRTRSADIQAAFMQGDGIAGGSQSEIFLALFFRHLTALGIPHSLG